MLVQVTQLSLPCTPVSLVRATHFQLLHLAFEMFVTDDREVGIITQGARFSFSLESCDDISRQMIPTAFCLFGVTEYLKSDRTEILGWRLLEKIVLLLAWLGNSFPRERFGRSGWLLFAKIFGATKLGVRIIHFCCRQWVGNWVRVHDPSLVSSPDPILSEARAGWARYERYTIYETRSSLVTSWKYRRGTVRIFRRYSFTLQQIAKVLQQAS